MMEKQKYNTWNEIVFEFRNKNYGAYLLRGLYAKNLGVAVTIAVVVAITALYAPAIAAMFKKEAAEAPVLTKTVKYADLAPPPPIDKNLPPPSKVNLPQVKKVIKFLPPKVTEQEVEKEEEMPKIEELKTVDTGAETVEGVEEVVFEGPAVEIPEERKDEVYTIVEQMPEFSGGYEALMTYISKNIKYPAPARRMGIEGTVYIGFVINQDGSVQDISVIRGIGAGCDEEAARIIGKMPQWRPGKQNGDPVKVKFVLPIKFQLG